MPETVDVIIVTLDNAMQLYQCVNSLRVHNEYPIRMIVVNNGEQDLEAKSDDIMLIKTGKNLGWTGALQEGLKHSKSKYVVFANDDIYIPYSSKDWLKKIIAFMEEHPEVGAVGPASNCVSGRQNIFAFTHTEDNQMAPYLIGFCLVLRREALDKAGGVHDVEVGGDDLDLSIRIKEAGYALISKRDAFVYHHGFQTGQRIFGGPEKAHGWNSREMIEGTAIELIKKHGFLKYWELFQA